MTRPLERTPWPHIYFDRGSGRLELHVGEYLSSPKGQEVLAAVKRIRIASERRPADTASGCQDSAGEKHG